MSRLPDELLNKSRQIFPELWPFANLGHLNFSARYLKNYLSKQLKYGQLIGEYE